MGKTTRTFRQAAVLIVGLPLVLLGIILIPLPGPGLLIVLLGLLILAREFTWAEKPLERLKSEFRQLLHKDRTKQDETSDKA